MELVEAQTPALSPFPFSLDKMGIAPNDYPQPPSTEDGSNSDGPLSPDGKCAGFEMPPDTEITVVLAENSPQVDALVGEGMQNEARAAVKLQKVYRSYRTRRRLADSAVVAEELWWQAIDFARLNHSTISFFNLHESVSSKWNRIRLNASKVGKGLSKDEKAQKLAFQHWIEAIDPRHRYGHNLHMYYEEWCKSDSGQPFFYWLDVGDGKELDLIECPRSRLRQQCIKYLGPQEREHYEYIIAEGKIIHSQTGCLLDTTSGAKGGKWIFVMSTFKRLYAGEKKKGMFHHSSFLAGGATLAAGRLRAELGILKAISPYSGHYRPTEDSFDSFKSFLQDKGVNLEQVEINEASEDTDVYGDSKFNEREIMMEFLKGLQPPMLENPIKEKDSSSELPELKQADSTVEYKRTLSGGLQSPRTEVPKKAILERINSKKAAKSNQLGYQLSRKWSTGAGPRIGCVADYPVQLRVQALEIVNLSPRTPHTPPTPLSYRRYTAVGSPADPPTPGIASGVGASRG